MKCQQNQKCEISKNGVDILNAVRNDASLSFQERVPVATQEDIKTYGSAVLNFPGLANEFLDALVNRIGKVILSSRLYKNPFAMLKKGMLDYGETIEEVYTSLAKAKIYDPQTAETEFMKREIPDVKSISISWTIRTSLKRRFREEIWKEPSFQRMVFTIW